jgi:serine O-acetyltransferase
MIRADVYRNAGKWGSKAVILTFLDRPANRFLLVMRVGSWARGSRTRLPVQLVCRALYRRWSVRYALEIPYTTQIGAGLRISHIAGGVVVNPTARIGKNCTLNGGVTLGHGVVLGNLVNVSTGAKLIGRVTVRDGSTIGANAVVTKEVPPGSVVAGVPAKVLPHSVQPEQQHVDWPGGPTH